jgi:hypothetical protein
MHAGLNEYFSNYRNIGHNSLSDLIILWIIPKSVPLSASYPRSQNPKLPNISMPSIMDRKKHFILSHLVTHLAIEPHTDKEFSGAWLVGSGYMTISIGNDILNALSLAAGHSKR